MKRKILALGLCALALFNGEAKAFFGLLSPYHPASLWHKHNRYVTHITCRPYNAFTPICWGNLVCDGCNPSPCGVASGQLPLMMGAPPFACPCPGYDGGGQMFAGGPGFGGCGPQGCMASDMGMMPPPPMHGPGMHGPPMQMPMPGPNYMPSPGHMPTPGPLPDIRNQPWDPPPPNLVPNGPNIGMYPPPGVAQANYYPMYSQPYPNYYMPQYYNPYQQAWPNAQQPTPYYWYGGR